MRIVSLHRYPVKGMRGVDLDTAEVEPQGLAGDRRYMVVDTDGVFLSQREVPALATINVRLSDDGLLLSADVGEVAVRPALSMPGERAIIWQDTVSVVAVEPAADDFLAGALQRPARLVYQAEPNSRPVDTRYGGPDDRVSLADGFPLLVTHTASLADLNTRLETPVPMARFRPNIVIEGGVAWEEDDWCHLSVGDVRLEAVKPCGRCVVTTRDQDTGAQPDGEEPLRTLTKFRMRRGIGPVFGQNFVPRALGTLQVGNAVSLER